MKKTITLCLFLITVTIKAQIFTEDFNAGIPATFTLTDLDGSTSASTMLTGTGSFSAFTIVNEDCAGSVSWFTPVGQADDWMVTPAINIPNTTNGVVLKFDGIAYEAAYSDGVEVYVSTTGTSPSDFTSPAIYNSTPTTPGPNPVGGELDVWTERIVSLNSFVGQTIYIAFRNNSNDMHVLGIDNIMVQEMQDDEAELTSLDIMNFSVAPATIDIKGIITNAGGNIINTIDLIWTDGINSYTDNLTNLNLAPGLSYNFTHADQLTMTTPGSANITVNIDLVNNNIDPNLTNNTLSALANAVTYIPTKRVVFEEATGTWCGWCPRGAVGLETLAQNYPGSAIGIAVHNGDNMTVSAYDGGMNVGGYPSGHVDRAILDVDPGQFTSYYSDRINVISPVDISATAIFDPATRMIDINLSAEFVATLSGDYRFNAVILEDEVGPFSQANYYSGGGAGPLVSPISGFDWTTATDPVNVIFDHVARAILGGFDGTANSIPSAITAGSIHTFNYTHSLPATENENKVHVVGMVIDNVSGEILNAVSVALSGFTPASWDCVNNACIDPGTGLGQYSSLGSCDALCNVTVINENAELEINIYPNPVKDVLTIDGIYNSVNIYDVFGKLVLTSQTQKIIDVSTLNNGVYMLEINTEQAVKTKKITVAK
jgi:thiol-disulfide isomerase/thioredoxin